MKIVTMWAWIKDNVEHIQREIPFRVELPNKTTLRTFKDTDANKKLVHSKNAKEMFDKLVL